MSLIGNLFSFFAQMDGQTMTAVLRTYLRLYTPVPHSNLDLERFSEPQPYPPSTSKLDNTSLHLCAIMLYYNAFISSSIPLIPFFFSSPGSVMPLQPRVHE